MIEFQLDEEKLRKIFDQKVDEYLKQIEHESFFMTFKDLTKYLNMSTGTIREFLLYREDFPAIRLGTKWLFPRKEIGPYMEKYLEEVKAAGGDMNTLKRFKMKRGEVTWQNQPRK